MGLPVNSLFEIPFEARRQYYIYLLDYGWHEPLSEVLSQNFTHMAEIASKNNAVVIRSSERGDHFSDEVFSWHGINGEDDYCPQFLLQTAIRESLKKITIIDTVGRIKTLE